MRCATPQIDLRRLCIVAIGLFTMTTAWGLTGCDAALVDGSYRGEPLLTLHGSVQIVADKTSSPGGGGKGKPGNSKEPKPPLGPGASPVTLPDGQLRLAIVWESTAVNEGTSTTMSAVEQSMVLTSSFPARYELVLFTPPSDEMTHASTAAGRYALGTIVAYADTDDDGRFDPSVDSLLGGARGRALLYTPDGVTAPWLSAPLGEGYHRLRKRLDKASCVNSDHVLLQPDAAIETHLQVFERFPHNVLLDLDCNGKGNEWGGACPPRYHLHKICPKAPKDSWVCSNCPR